MYTIVDSSNFSLENYPYDMPTAILVDEDPDFENPEFSYICEGREEGSQSILKLLYGNDSSWNNHYIVLDENNQPLRYIWNYGD